jgi:hypothetical protein
MLNNRSKFFGNTLLLSTVLVGGVCLEAGARELNTKSFRVEITANCEEGVVVCDNVSYVGTNLKTGRSIQLRGKTMHSICADGITPCRFLGYEFRNGQYRYYVAEEGILTVYQGQRSIVSEEGVWEP